MTKNEIKSQVKLALNDLNVNKVILFGSYAKGTPSKESDIDLLVVTNDNFVFKSFAQKMEIKLKIANALISLRKHAGIDLIVHTKQMYNQFFELNGSFKKEIMTSGSVIYEGNN
jgi:predicted nucleotidyltransferase